MYLTFDNVCTSFWWRLLRCSPFCTCIVYILYYSYTYKNKLNIWHSILIWLHLNTIFLKVLNKQENIHTFLHVLNPTSRCSDSIFTMWFVRVVYFNSRMRWVRTQKCIPFSSLHEYHVIRMVFYGLRRCDKTPKDGSLYLIHLFRLFSCVFIIFMYLRNSGLDYDLITHYF